MPETAQIGAFGSAISGHSPIEEVIEACKDWTLDTALAMKTRVGVRSGALQRSIKGRVKLRNQEPYAIAFEFARYGAWLEKGAGKGAGGSVGSAWYNKKGEKKYTNPRSKNKMGIKRQERPWFDETIQERLPILSDLISRQLSSSLVRYAGMR
jgi:hypothetical protein